SPFVVITGESGMAVIGYVSELKLGSIKVGDEYTVYSWETGNTTTAKVAEISPYPAENFNSWTNGNSNVSWYPFTAYMESAEGFTPGFGVEMTPVVEEEEGEVIVLEKVYVRSDEKGNYVLKEDENGRLERADVTVKSTSEAGYLQILSGLSTTDRIAFPYGNKAVVGMKTTDKPPISLF
nr:efflux RND transporter periplasmic adaptor subunit [Lachnospiraceae bacterium]